MSDARDPAALERRLRGVREPAMRRELVLEALEAGEPEEGYALLREAMHRREGETPALPGLRACVAEVIQAGGAQRELDYELRAALYAEAAAREDETVMRMLRTPDSVRAMEEPGRALQPAMAEIPLGVRRSLARGFDRSQLERLLLDADPVVIGHLLANPRVTEDDVVRIAARRPIPGSTLEEIARSARFGTRPTVRLALARNPYAPTDVAVRALGSLLSPDLREIARDATLHEAVRRHAADELRRRGVDA